MPPPHLSQFNNRTVLIDSRHVMDVHHIPVVSTKGLTPEAIALRTGLSTSSDYKPYSFQDGIAIIKVEGVLIHNYGWSSSYATGYDVIQRKLHYAWHDPDVKGILMLFNTPGGTVHGGPDTGDLIARVGKDKPVWGLSEDMAYSAGEWLHSQCTRRFVTQSAGLGSVGARITHVDMSKAYEEHGFKVTMIFDGEHKVDGNPFEELPEDVKASLQQEVSEIRQQFASMVATGTGMTLEAVLETEAQCYTGQHAVDIGLAESVVNRIDLTQQFIEHLRKQDKTNLAGITMSVTNEEITASKQDERTRIKAITACEEAKGKGKLAEYLAYETDMSQEEAVKILAASEAQGAAPQTPETKVDGFTQAMGSEQHPNLSSDADVTNEEEDNESPQAIAARMAKSHQAAKGYK